MAAWLTILLLLGLWLESEMEVEAATYIDTTPHLWIKPESPSIPWANVSLECHGVHTLAVGFQLWKDGEVFASLPVLAPYVSFPLGPVTAEKGGIYQCRLQKGKDHWGLMSAPVEVTGTEPLPAPSFRAEPGPWILHGVETTLHCQGALLGMTFGLHRDGEQEPVDSSPTPEPKATFIVNSTGNYTCHYRPSTEAPWVTSAPSETIYVVRPDSLPKPILNSWDNLVVGPGDSMTFQCRTRFSGLAFELYKDGKEVSVDEKFTSSPEWVNFRLKNLEPGAGGKYSCRYRFWSEPLIWSEDSESRELILTTGSLPKPSLSVQPPDAVISQGTNVTLQCRGSQPNVRFALLKKGSSQPEQLLSPGGAHADFTLSDAGADHTGNYSCLYFQMVSPFEGSPRSEDVEVHVVGKIL